MVHDLSQMMQKVALTDASFDTGKQDNNAYVEALVFFDANAPMLSRHVLDNHEAVFNQAPSHLLVASNKRTYVGIEVQIPSWEFKRFSKDMANLSGVVGLTLTAEATPAQFKQYGRYCLG